MCGLLIFYAVGEISVLGFFHKTHGFCMKREKGRSPKSSLCVEKDSPRALLFSSSQRLLTAHLSPRSSGSGGPPSPQQSLIWEQTPALLRTANSAREARSIPPLVGWEQLSVISQKSVLIHVLFCWRWSTLQEISIFTTFFWGVNSADLRHI